MPLLRTCLTLLLLLGALRAQAIDESQLLPIDEAFRFSARALDAESVELRWEIAEGYYLYQHRTSAQADGEGMDAGELVLPPGTPYTDDFFGDVETYRIELVGRLDGVRAGAEGRLDLRVRYQGCADVGICYPPHQQRVSLQLPVSALGSPAPGGSALPLALPSQPLLPGSTPPSLLATPVPFTVEGTGDPGQPLPEEQAFQFEAIAAAPDLLLLRISPARGYYLYRDRNSFRIVGDEAEAGRPRWPEGQAHRDEHFGEVLVYFDPVEIELPIARRSGAATSIEVLAEFQGCQTDGICYPPMFRSVQLQLPAGSARELPPEDRADARAPISFTAALLALLGAVAGGLILNLMPCVLPVLSLKAIGLAQSGENAAKARAHALWYTLGVLASFAALGALALGLRAAGQALGWGFQLQQPLFVGFVVYVMFAVGLALSGVYTLGGGLAGMGQGLAQRGGAAGDFFTGVLAVVVASPCTAPFMGPALAFAFAAPPVLAIGLFLALGLGLALPFLLIGFVPALAQRLPRPGAWMETFKNVLAFPMYLTAVWLLWVVTRQRGADAMALVLIGLVVLGAGLWAFERARYAQGARARVLAWLLIGASLLPLAALHWLPAQAQRAAVQAEGVEAYSAARLAALRGEGRTVFVNMTADWCVTCKANEARLFNTGGFRSALDAHEAVYMVGDWTDVDPAITAFLEQHRAVGVPLYVVFRPGEVEGRVLPIVPTLAAVEAALRGDPR
ncbi:MAG: thioredoxin family protein [Aquimonas sp.]|nr:thioredoxin family protein [Aquimonas sp.]